MEPSTSVVRVVASVAAVAVVVAAAGCAGSTDVTRPVPVGATPSSTAASTGPSAVRRRRAARPWRTVPRPPVGATPGATPRRCAPRWLRVEAGLVAGPLGLDDEAEPQDRAAVRAETARLEARLPASVVRDLEVLARPTARPVRLWTRWPRRSPGRARRGHRLWSRPSPRSRRRRRWPRRLRPRPLPARRLLP